MLEAWAAAAAADEESPEEEEENPPGQLLSSVPENERRGVAARQWHGRARDQRPQKGDPDDAAERDEIGKVELEDVSPEREHA